MTENKTGEKTLSLTGAKTLTLKKPVGDASGTVRQSFSHGRSKTVVVEKVRRRLPGEKDSAPVVETTTINPAGQQPVAPANPKPNVKLGLKGDMRRAQLEPSIRPTGVVLRTLSSDEKDARAQALAEAHQREIIENKRREEEAKQRAEREAREQIEREAALLRKREEEDRSRREQEAHKHGEPAPAAAPARRRLGETVIPAASNTAITAPKRDVPQDAKPALPAQALPPRALDDMDDDGPRGAVKRGGMKIPAVAVPKEKRDDGRSRGRLTVTNAMATEEERSRSVASFRRRVQRMKNQGHAEQKEKIIREVTIPETITIQDLANRMAERAVDVIRLLMKQGIMKKINDLVDGDTAQLIVEELGHTAKRVAEADVEEGLFTVEDAAENLVYRAPVVTIMGHVDHGKTSLLDAIRSANVVSGEAGGITQHIGAYQVTSPLGGKITFIDTPGHAAFTSMRARGAKVTDIVVLVVAADDGVMPQTVEAISHAKAAQVPIIVAINKIDKPEAKPERVRTELLQHEIVVESMGGDTLEIEVSAKARMNLDKLLEAITLQSEILDLKANPNRAAEGTVIEAKLDKGRGPVATVLVERGTLRQGDIIVAGSEWGRVRALIADTGGQIADAGPALPVEVLGFNGVPDAGDRVAVVENEARAREITEYRSRMKRDKMAAKAQSKTSLADMMSQLKTTAGRKEFPLVIKGDVQGSVEAIVGALEKLGNDEVQARVLHMGVGGITESDITLAEASKAAVIGFNVRAHKEAREAAERSNLEIRYYSIIYNLVDDVKAAMSGLLDPTLRENTLGTAQILEVFAVSKVGKVAGCRVTEGVVQKGASVRLIRDNVVIHEGKLSTLKRFKDDAKEVVVGQECGMAFENYQDMRPGDVIECFRVEEIKRTL